MLVWCFQFVFFQLIIHQQIIGQQKKQASASRQSPAPFRSRNGHSVKTPKFAPYSVLIPLMLIYTPQMLSPIVGTKKRVIQPLPPLSPFAGAPRGVSLGVFFVCVCGILFQCDYLCSFICVVPLSSVYIQYIILYYSSSIQISSVQPSPIFGLCSIQAISH